LILRDIGTIGFDRAVGPLSPSDSSPNKLVERS
jgi:hypothetical protein